ncbi:hypothetical protein FGO68_gene7000 [Halteria grandinella]|uniref:Uncharacterized protein n=1 Tax=Halteria grandinella TaxID=5974 RepID=A0A8J8P6A1_HALGN|nr:hypothetical protein FGO68_gene7000 [Halteria grandinella]
MKVQGSLTADISRLQKLNQHLAIDKMKQLADASPKQKQQAGNSVTVKPKIMKVNSHLLSRQGQYKKSILVKGFDTQPLVDDSIVNKEEPGKLRSDSIAMIQVSNRSMSRTKEAQQRSPQGSPYGGNSPKRTRNKSMRPGTTLQGKKRRSNLNAIISGGMNFNQESFKLLAKKIGHSKQTRNLLERPGDTNYTTNSVAKGQLFKSYLEANIAPPIKDLPRQNNDSTQMISTNFETSALSKSLGRNSKLQTMRSRELKNLQLQLALQSRNQTMLGETNPYNQTTNLGFTESPQAEQRTSLEFRQRNLGNLIRLVRNSKSTQKNRGGMGNHEKYKTTTCIMNPMRELARLKQLKGIDTARQSNGPPKNETFAQILG